MKIATLIFHIWRGGCRDQVKEYAAEFSAHHCSLMVPLLSLALARSLLDKILVILLATTKLREWDTILLNVSYSCNTLRFGL